jgi:hypothetical protein
LLSGDNAEMILSRERFVEIPGTGNFTTDIYATVFGPTSFAVPYQGLFTGVGGKLGATGVTWREGVVNLTIYPEGDLIYNFETTASSIISGELYYSTKLSGSLTGTVGPGDFGQYHFDQAVTGPVDTAYHHSTLQLIAPSVFSTFTGYIDRVMDLESAVIGEYNFSVVDTVEVSEGYPTFLELWDMTTFDIDRGPEHYKEHGWYDAYGYKNSGLTYRIPAETKISGQVRYINDYDEQILSKMILRVTDFNSINETISIQSR